MQFMTKAEYMALAESKYDELQALQEAGNFYEYEKRFDQLWIELGRAVPEQSLGTPPLDRRKKKTLCRYGKIEIANEQCFSHSVHGYQSSPYMQEKRVYAGQCDC